MDNRRKDETGPKWPCHPITCRHGSCAQPEMEVLRLKVKYCGGCNPDIDRGKVVEGLIEVMTGAGLAVKLCSDDPEVVLLVNGCPHACLEQDDLPADRGAMCIFVQGAQLDFEPVQEERLHEVIWERIAKFRRPSDHSGTRAYPSSRG